MRVHATGDVEEYAAAAAAFLRADPCARNVLLTIIDLVRSAPATYSAAPSFWWITDADAVVGAASWTPPHGLLVSSLPPEVAGDLATAAIQRATALGLRPRGVNGPADSARAVAAAWTDATDDTIERDRPILLNELVSLVEVPVPPGARRRGLATDVPVIARWLETFSAEVEHAAPTNALGIAAHMVQSEHLDVWVVDGQIVCMTGYRDAAGVVRIGPVYTPREHRNHGYARRLTYEVTALALQRPDVAHAMLFTDAANPVSNSIYRQAGYQPRGEHVEIEFAKRSVGPGH
ncbi:MAG: GNAT family N-acetyltransferase [Candidatus Dormibacteria bacterium]